MDEHIGKRTFTLPSYVTDRYALGPNGRLRAPLGIAAPLPEAPAGPNPRFAYGAKNP